MSFLKLPLDFSSALRGTLSRYSLAGSIAQQLMGRFKKLVAQQPPQKPQVDGQFVAPTNQINDLLTKSNGNISVIEKALGIPKGDWQNRITGDVKWKRII